MNWSSHEFIWLDWVVLIVGLLGVVAALEQVRKMVWVWPIGRCRDG